MDQSKPPQDTIVELLGGLNDIGFVTKINRIQQLCRGMALKNTPVAIRNMIYDAYTRHHANTVDFDDKLIKDQNELLTSFLRLPFCLEFAHAKTLGKLLLTFVSKEFDHLHAAAQVGINSTLMCLDEHGFSGECVQEAIRLERNTPVKEGTYNETLLLYLISTAALRTFV
jgi:hypothetical protein